MKPLTIRMIWLTIFSIAMGFLETAVVVYLRKIYYPNGFQFPLIPVGHDIATAEFLREAATIIMLIGVGAMVGKDTFQRFAFFIYCFAIWDIFYYVFLKVLIDWPQSVFTWDILFIIPVPWVGPVLAPCVISATMIVLAFSIIYFQEKGHNAYLNLAEWVLFIIGCIFVIASFILDYFQYASNPRLQAISYKTNMFGEISHYTPSSYNWFMFSAGEVVIIMGILFFITRMVKKKSLFSGKSIQQ